MTQDNNKFLFLFDYLFNTEIIQQRRNNITTTNDWSPLT